MQRSAILFLMLGVLGLGVGLSACGSEKAAEAACSCEQGKQGTDVWCEKCSAGYVDGTKTKCRSCFEGKTGTTIWCEGCEAGYVDGDKTKCKEGYNAPVDVLLADGITDSSVIRPIAEKLNRPFAYNQIEGGKSCPTTAEEMRAAGVGVAIYSTPCLFAAHKAIENDLIALKRLDGALSLNEGENPLKSCNDLLQKNLN